MRLDDKNECRAIKTRRKCFNSKFFFRLVPPFLYYTLTDMKLCATGINERECDSVCVCVCVCVCVFEKERRGGGGETEEGLEV